MYLHENRELFAEVLQNTAVALGIPIAIVEKDYYVTMLLGEIVKRQPNVIFKGGTSLSKCYHLIQRFSEDIDLNIDVIIGPSEGQKRHLKENIVSSIVHFGFVLVQPEEVRSRRDFNRYVVSYPTTQGVTYLNSHLIIETSVAIHSFPNKYCMVGSLVYDYLKQEEQEGIIADYQLLPFEVLTQSLERTLIDKLFALGDYYMSGRVQGHSRHIYDVYKLISVVKIDSELKKLLKDVAQERGKHPICLSAGEGIDLRRLLTKIVEEESYREDYERITAKLLYEPISYEKAVQSIQELLQSDLFD